MNDLKPCPFCGEAAKLVSAVKPACGVFMELWTVVCVDGTCIASDISPECSDIEAAARAWNRRPDYAQAP